MNDDIVMCLLIANALPSPSAAAYFSARRPDCVTPPPVGIIGGMAVAAVDAWGRALETMTCANVTLGA